MHDNSFPSDDLSGLESRLSSWQPTDSALGADAMLFAAGQGSRQGLIRGRRLWAALACTMTVLCMGLVAWLLVERTDRQHLEGLLAQRSRPVAPVPSDTNVPPNQDGPAENYLMLRNRLVEKGVDAANGSRPEPIGSSLPGPPEPILHVGQRHGLTEF
jgi:hypothetical protein